VLSVWSFGEDGGAIREEPAAEMRRRIRIRLDGPADVDVVSAEDIPTFTKRGRRVNQC
jgi:hypothetical protein